MKKFVLALGLAPLALAGTALAADLPLAEPVEYVKVCDTYGKAFFYIPGTDTCLQISALVRVDIDAEDDDLNESSDDLFTEARARLRFDARTETEWGTLRSYIEYEGTNRSNGGDNRYDDADFAISPRQAYIQFAGITAGKVARSFYDFVPYSLIGDLFSDEQVWTLAYTAEFADDFEVTIAVEDKYYRADPDETDLDQVWPNIVAALGVTQDWGSARISAAVQDNQGDLEYADGSDDIGWAVQAGVAFNLPTANKGSKVWVQGAYTEGALSYIGGEDFTHFRNEGFPGFNDNQISGGVALNTEAYSVGGGFAWALTKTVTTNVGAIYVDIDQAYANTDIEWLFVEGNVNWKPVSGLSLTAALQYGEFDSDNTVLSEEQEDHIGGVIRIERSF